MKRVGRATERAMGMTDAVWERHANPWSGWTRMATLPLLTLAVWSRVWIGWWWLVPTAIAIAWTWINPRLFSAPASVNSWMSRGVLGERIWLAAKEDDLAAHHRRAIRATTWIAGLGAAAWLAGLVWLDLTATLTGLCVSMLGKLWFIDRMVWIQREAKESSGS